MELRNKDRLSPGLDVGHAGNLSPKAVALRSYLQGVILTVLEVCHLKHDTKAATPESTLHFVQSINCFPYTQVTKRY